MKKTFIAILAIAALAACAKTGIDYETPAEIGFAPVTKNITKAEGLSGDLKPNQELGIWAYWNNSVEVGEDGTLAVAAADYASYTDNYLVNALFAKRNDITNWGGSPIGHPWPLNGALVFAGYTTPADTVLTTGSKVGYDLVSNTMTFTEYENANEFDLCWFGRTSNAYNQRSAGTAIGVTLSHALTWITIQVYAEGSPIGNWTITSMTLNDVVTKGTATCIGTTATWSPVTTEDEKQIYSGSHTLSANKTALTDNVIIPSTPLELTVNFSFNVNGTPKTDSKTVSLKLNDANTETWVNGVHYTYTLLFKGNEILVAPSYKDWTESPRDNITVE